jgi:hypothetical protein
MGLITLSGLRVHKYIFHENTFDRVSIGIALLKLKHTSYLFLALRQKIVEKMNLLTLQSL